MNIRFKQNLNLIFESISIFFNFYLYMVTVYWLNMIIKNFDKFREKKYRECINLALRILPQYHFLYTDASQNWTKELGPR